MAEFDDYYDVGTPFNLSTSRAIGTTANASRIWQETENTMCIPSRANYTVNITYSGGAQTITGSQKYVSSIIDMIPTNYPYEPSLEQCQTYLDNNDTTAYENCIEYEPAIWPAELVQVLTAYNHFALIDAVISPLSGNYTMLESGQFAGGTSSYVSCGTSIVGAGRSHKY